MKKEENERRKGNKYIDFLKIQNVSKTNITNKEICRINNLRKKKKLLQMRKKSFDNHKRSMYLKKKAVCAI